MKTEIKCIFFALVMVLPGCQKKMNVSEYVQYLRNDANGYRKEIVVDNWKYEIQYKPSEYILLSEKAGEQTREKRMNQLKGTAWFNISIMRSDGSISPLKYNVKSREEYERRFNYYLNDMSKEYKLVYGDDTLRPIGYEFENNFNLSPKETMVVGFRLPAGNDEPVKDMQLIFHDELFKNGIIKAKFTKEILKQIPTLVH